MEGNKFFRSDLSVPWSPGAERDFQDDSAVAHNFSGSGWGRELSTATQPSRDKARTKNSSLLKPSLCLLHLPGQLSSIYHQI